MLCRVESIGGYVRFKRLVLCHGLSFRSCHAVVTIEVVIHIHSARLVNKFGDSLCDFTFVNLVISTNVDTYVVYQPVSLICW